MSLRKQLTLFTALMALGTTSVWAACTRGPAPTVRLDMAMGKVVVYPDLPIGGTIAEREWTMAVDGRLNYTCKGASNVVFSADIIAPRVTDTRDKVYTTNVPGIGLRFSRGGDKVNIIYPSAYAFPLDNLSLEGSRFSLEGSHFTLEIIKTESVTGSGALAAGQYTSYDWENGNKPILETFLSANAITIVSPSCTVLSGKNMNVDVGVIRRSDLNGVGTTAGGKDFNIELQCSGGLSESGYTNVQTSFSGTLATGTTLTQGALLNEKSGTSLARGIGIQVLKDGAPLEFDKKYNVGTLLTEETRYITLPLHARFYQYGPITSTGEVESHMIFNLTYD